MAEYLPGHYCMQITVFIQSADVFLATAVDKTVEALVGQNKVGEISMADKVVPRLDNASSPDYTPTPKLIWE